MRYSKDELVALRKAAIKSESLVTRKIKRMAKGDYGIDISGMEYDPRVGKDAISRMSGDRLKKLLEKQAYFRKAHVGYYKGARGTIVTRQSYRNYVNSVRKINNSVDAEQAKYQNMFIKPLGMTVKERRAMMTPTHPVHGTEAYDGMKKLKIYSPTQLMGTEGAKMIALRNDDIRRQYTSRELVSKARGYMNDMMDIVGDEELRGMFNSLSDEQFWFIWAYTDFPNELALKYDAMQLQMRVLDGSNQLSDGMIDSAIQRGEQSIGRALEYYKYAKTLDI
jgi:hypothetical protein|nr:MAG TPA: hypothetical protein [Caudoviricetes sp.]